MPAFHTFIYIDGICMTRRPIDPKERMFIIAYGLL